MHDNLPDENILQSSPASCAIKCQQIILRDYGIDVSEEDLCRIAKVNGWYDEKVGVYMHDNGKLLGCFGVGYTHSQHNDLQTIRKELALGHSIMVSVNQAKLAEKPDIHNQASHSVVVNAMNDTIVYITNPGSGNPYESIMIGLFITAWEDSCCYMLHTCDKAIYMYDPVLKIMVERNC